MSPVGMFAVCHFRAVDRGRLTDMVDALTFSIPGIH